MTLTLAEWDVLIGKHLHEIEAGAELVERHCQQMGARPEFVTLAFEDIEVAEASLKRALQRLFRAKAAYQEKPPVA